MRQRLQKLIASAGLCSRREAEKWIQAGRVWLNGELAEVGASADPAVDQILVDGKPLPGSETRYYLMLNKPVGYVTTVRDPEGRPTVIDLVDEIPARLFPVGRLDLTTSGLLLLTNDGEFANQLAHPRHQVEKAYLVRVRGQLAAEIQRRLETGVVLEDGPTLPARIEDVRGSRGHTWFTMVITEGRNRQVRRMCEAVGLPVSRLKRIRIGSLHLGDLGVGCYRALSVTEITRLQSEQGLA